MTTNTDITAPHAEAFTFGEPEPVLDQREILQYFHASLHKDRFEPPVSFEGLAKSLRANPHHESAVRFKVNQLAKYFIPDKTLTRYEFKRLAFDYLVFGNCFVEEIRNRLGEIIKLQTALARWMRKKNDGSFVFIANGRELEYDADKIHHVMDPDLTQEIYGMPGYISCLQSALLNEAATLFRRKYYKNGSHAGFILYVSDAMQNQEDVDAIRSALKDSKGPGNFRNLFMYAPGGQKDGVQVIPISEVTAKDEFMHMKNITRDDVLSAHRIPPQLLGIVPTNAGGFGSIADAAMVFHMHEIEPLQSVFLDLNDMIGQEVIRFDDYVPIDMKSSAKG